MTKENQKILYDDFVKNAVEGKTDIQRENCKKEAAEILKSFPDFEVKKKVEEKPVLKETKEKK